MQNLYLYKREMCILKETAAVKWKDICFTFCLTDIFSPNTRTFQMALFLIWYAKYLSLSAAHGA